MSSPAFLLTSYSPERNKLLVIDPIADIEAAKQRQEWITCFVLSVTYFERVARQKLLRELAGRISEERIERLDPYSLAVLLFGLNIIDQPDYSWMIQIIEKRNDIVHPRKQLPKIEERESEQLVNKVIEILRKLVP